MDSKELQLVGEELNYHTQEIVKYVTTANYSYLKIAEHLKAVKDKKLYTRTNDGLNTWSSYCDGIKIHSKKADMYIKIFEYYREKLQLPENEILQVTINDLNRLKAPLEKLPNDTERMEVWEKMKALPYRDLNKELVKDKIIAKPKLKVTRCEHCNQLIIYYSQEDICVCKGTHAVFAMPIEA